jgi:hypothetical protein
VALEGITSLRRAERDRGREASVARVGSTLLGGLKIEKRKIRGEIEGMPARPVSWAWDRSTTAFFRSISPTRRRARRSCRHTRSTTSA